MKHLKFLPFFFIILLAISSIVYAQKSGVQSCLFDIVNPRPPKREGVTRAVFHSSKKWLPGQKVRVKFLDGTPQMQEKVKNYSS